MSSPSSCPDPVSYESFVMPIGLHKGSPLSEIPLLDIDGLLGWLGQKKMEGAFPPGKFASLERVLRDYLAEHHIELQQELKEASDANYD